MPRQPVSKENKCKPPSSSDLITLHEGLYLSCSALRHRLGRNRHRISTRSFTVQTKQDRSEFKDRTVRVTLEILCGTKPGIEDVIKNLDVKKYQNIKISKY